MKNIFIVTKANLKKNKGQAIGLLFFVMIAAMLLNIGLLLQLRFQDSFEKRAEELHTPHYVLVENKQLFNQSQLDYLKNYPRVTEAENEECIFFMSDMFYNGGKMSAELILLNADVSRRMNNLALIEGRAPQSKDEICLPYMFKAGGGYDTGDTFTVTSFGTSVNFKISGFSEEIFFGSLNNSFYQIYVSADGFVRLGDLLPGSESEILRVRMENPYDSDRLYQDAAMEFWYEGGVSNSVFGSSMLVESLDWQSVVNVRTMMSNITAVILVLFAVMIVAISLLVVSFRIRNTIEESMTNIGALKAVGYTGRQLVNTLVLQFGLIGCIGTLLGIAASYTALPFISNVLEAQTALIWNQSFDLTCSLFSLFFIFLVIVATAWFAAKKIRKLAPLIALRQGLVTHSFKKNHFPLDKTRGVLSWLIALKATLQSKKQTIIIAIIVAAVTFAAAASVSLYDNMALSPTAFGQLLAGEAPDCAFFMKDFDSADLTYNYISADGTARKIFYYQNVPAMREETMTDLIVSDGFDQFEGTLLYEGRYPKHNNETSISGVVSAQENKGIGDKITLKQGDQSAEYLIVGLIQTVNNGGNSCAVTVNGVRRLQVDFQPRCFYVYLNDPLKTKDFVAEINGKFGTAIETAVNLYELMDAQLSMYGDIFGAIAFVIIAVTVIIIFLVLYLMLKTVILRSHRELGIQKALGFTTIQLMNQFSLQFMPVVILGILTGGITGILGFNPIFVGLTKSLGIMNASLPAPVGLTIAMCMILALLTYGFAMLICSRIRKVSAYMLVSE